MGSLPGGGKMMQITRRTEGRRNIIQVREVNLWDREGGERETIPACFLSFLCEVILLQGFNYHFFVLVVFARCSV